MEQVYIAIEGPIGVGKTTLARMLQPEFGAELLLEIFEENPFLSDFYADRERFAFQTQIFFLLSRYHQQQGVWRTVQRLPLISDYTFAKDRLFAHLNLHGDELETYERLHRALAERVAIPDLIVYLRASPDALMERIATRDRPYERNMAASYLTALAHAYEQFFASHQDSRILTIDTDRLNVVRNPADLEGVVVRVHDALATAPRAAAAGAAVASTFGPLPPARAEAVAADLIAPTLDLPLYLEFLAFQRATGEMAAALLRSGPAGAAAGDLEPLHKALAACRRSLERMAQSVDARAGAGPGALV